MENLDDASKFFHEFIVLLHFVVDFVFGNFEGETVICLLYYSDPLRCVRFLPRELTCRTLLRICRRVCIGETLVFFH